MRNPIRPLLLLRLLILSALAPLVGCASIQDCEYEAAQKMRAWHAFQDFKHTCCAPLSLDYACGWKAGYYDVVTGGTGCPPIIAPKLYWKPSQILAHCDKNRHQWYVGFQDGAAYAAQMPDTHYLKLWLPPCRQCACQTPVCEPSACPAVEEGYEIEQDFDFGESYLTEPVPAFAAPIGESNSEADDSDDSADEEGADDNRSNKADERDDDAAEDSQSAEAPSALDDFQILEPLDLALSDGRLEPFIKQAGTQIRLMSGTSRSSENEPQTHILLQGSE